jgi:hypothetical protein
VSAIPIYDHRPWSPYFVFVKSIEMTDRGILEALRLPAYVRIPSMEHRFDYLAIGRDSHWTHVADNYGYTHWHSKDFRDAVSELAARLEVFSFSVGDSDMSFDLQLYRSGHLVRRFVWEDRDYSGGRLQEQFGSPLEFETTIPCGKDPLDGLWRVASALGIECDYTKLNLMLYAPTPQASH